MSSNYLYQSKLKITNFVAKNVYIAQSAKLFVLVLFQVYFVDRNEIYFLCHV
jgi:hypothetical protein